MMGEEGVVEEGGHCTGRPCCVCFLLVVYLFVCFGALVLSVLASQSRFVLNIRVVSLVWEFYYVIRCSFVRGSSSVRVSWEWEREGGGKAPPPALRNQPSLALPARPSRCA